MVLIARYSVNKYFGHFWQCFNIEAESEEDAWLRAERDGKLQYQSVYREPKDTESSVSNYIVVYAKCKYDGYFTDYPTYYVAYAFKDAYMSDGTFNYRYDDYSYSDKDLANLKKYEGYVNNKTDYTITPIM